MIKKNEGSVDRMLRVLLGLVLAYIASTNQIQWLYIVAALLLITGITGFCAIYTLFGMDTNKTDKD